MMSSLDVDVRCWLSIWKVALIMPKYAFIIIFHFLPFTNVTALAYIVPC